MLKSILGSSPRTTIIGYVSAILFVIIPMIQAEGFDINTQWKNLLTAAVLAVWGRVQKDSNGITRQEAKQIVGKAEIPKETIL